MDSYDKKKKQFPSNKTGMKWHSQLSAEFQSGGIRKMVDGSNLEGKRNIN